MHQPISTENADRLSPPQLGRLKNPVTRPKIYNIVLTITKICVGLALLVLSVQDVQLNSLVAGIRSADPLWLLLTVVVIVVGLGIKLLRWAILVRNYQVRINVFRLFSAYFVGQAANIILPLRGGELIRLGYFAPDKNLLPLAASTIVLEKYLDILALTACIVLVSLNISLENIMNLRGWLLPLSIVLTLLLLLVILFGPRLWGKIRDRKVLPSRLAEWLDRWVQASRWLSQPRLIFPVVLITIMIWVIMWFTNLLLFKSFGMPINITAAGTVLVLVYIGLFPALMPGNIGPFYFFARLALVPFGVIHDQALVFAIVLHAIVTLPPLLGGVIGLLIHSKPASQI